MEDREKIKCTICHTTMMKERYKLHMKLVHSEFEPKHSICEICGLGFPNKNYLARHSKCHLIDEKLVCTVCGIDTFITKEMVVIIRSFINL